MGHSDLSDITTILKGNRSDVNGKESANVHVSEVSGGMGAPCTDLMKAGRDAEEYLHRHTNAPGHAISDLCTGRT